MTPASGRQDPATSPSCRSRSSARDCSALRADRPPLPAPNARDDRETSLFDRGGMALDNHQFLKIGSRIFWREGLDRANQLGRTSEISFCAQRVSRVRRHGPSRHRERSDAIQGRSESSGLLRRSAPRNDGEWAALRHASIVIARFDRAIQSSETVVTTSLGRGLCRAITSMRSYERREHCQ